MRYIPSRIARSRFRHSRHTHPILFLSAALLLTLLTCAQPVAAQQTTTRYVNVDGVCGGHTPCYSTLQPSIDAASLGDTINVAAGQTFTGPFTLAPKPGGTGTDADYITIQSSNVALLPTGRISPGDALNMPKLVAPGGNFSVFNGSAINTKYYRLVGLEVTVANDTVVARHLIDLGSGDDKTRSTGAKHGFAHEAYVCMGTDEWRNAGFE